MNYSEIEVIERYMYYRIKNLKYIKNKFNCGHETIYCALMNMNKMNISIPELYFSSDPNCSEMIHDKVILGYNNLEKVISNINNNITVDIVRVIIKDKKREKDNIIEQISNNNIIVLYVTEAMLFYHNYRESRYPYHMVIADGFDLNKNLIHIVDLYVKDDYGVNIQMLDIDFDIIMKYTVEYEIFKYDKEKEINFINENVVISNLKKASEKCEESLLCKINKLFEMLETSDVEERINSVASFKWIIMKAYFINISDYLKLKRLEQYVSLVDELQKKWDMQQLKYIKCCYKSPEINIANKLGIFQLIDETVEMTKMVVNVLESMI